MTIQISEHLLAALKPSVVKKHNGDCFVSKLWSLFDCHLNCGSSMLSIINDKLSIHIDLQCSHPIMICIIFTYRFEADFPINRGCNC
ncbi:hypothetical protein AO265_14870 [Pseudomonas sp. ABAC61]|nr:hypothetical protein AO265_14870 [Pseudomonas sp. ABAC61]